MYFEPERFEIQIQINPLARNRTKFYVHTVFWTHPASNNIKIKLWTHDLSPQKIQDFEHMSNWIWTNTTFISWMTCYDSSLSDQDDPRSSEFFCLISATSIVTEEFFRQSQIFTLLNSLLWDGKIPWVPDFPRANKRYNKRQHALILFKSVNMIFFSISFYTTCLYTI